MTTQDEVVFLLQPWRSSSVSLSFSGGEKKNPTPTQGTVSKVTQEAENLEEFDEELFLRRFNTGVVLHQKQKSGVRVTWNRVDGSGGILLAPLAGHGQGVAGWMAGQVGRRRDRVDRRQVGPPPLPARPV